MACKSALPLDAKDDAEVSPQVQGPCNRRYTKKLERELAALKKKHQQLASMNTLTEKTNRQLLEDADEEYCQTHDGHERPMIESEDEENEHPSLLFSSSIKTKRIIEPDASKTLRKQGTVRKPVWSSSPPHLNLVTVSFDHRSKRPRSNSPDNSAPSRSKRACTIMHGEKGSNLRDYSGVAKSVIHEVLLRYENRIFTINAYPDEKTQSEIVCELWDEVSASVEQKFELTPALQSMIKKRGARCRGNIRDRIQPLIAPAYGFQVSDKKKIHQANKNLYVMLLTGGAFSFKTPGDRYRRFENKIIFQAICACWFKNQKTPGIKYSDDYDPIKPESVALIITVLENCIDEWASGKFVPKPLDEDVQRPRYLAHLADIRKWCKANPKVTGNILKRWHNGARSSTGVKAKQMATGYLNDEEEETRVMADLEGRTGETDSEDDDDDAENDATGDEE
ncbi:hypothetical protein EDD18DRAFT_1109668 [Armillaria luteobubalina]|uniref:DUF6532 domain-containing protein n=1 Tax=Armillaria luteobubalina TaxID=153913 RepID=A0AA39PUY1_9AGAR|nr:hypothetical protein EDD18DRAFT_1109668 [Armillaria luteobubalina]